MATVLHSSPVDRVSGSVGGETFLPARTGSILRVRAPRRQLPTPAQASVRRAFSRLINLWAGDLSPEERRAWDAYAASVARTGRDGRVRFLTGQNHFVRSNLPRLQSPAIGLAVVRVAPNVHDLGTFSFPSEILRRQTTQDLAVNFNPTDDWASETGSAMIVSAGPMQSAATRFYNGRYNRAGLIFGDDLTPPTSPALLAAPFVVLDKNPTFAQISVSRRDGRLSSTFQGPYHRPYPYSTRTDRRHLHRPLPNLQGHLRPAARSDRQRQHQLERPCRRTHPSPFHRYLNRP